MGTMRDFWARERLLRHTGERHDTNDISRIVDIAKTAGYLDQNGQLTELGRYLEREKFDRDEKSRDVHADLGAGTFVLQEQLHSGTA